MQYDDGSSLETLDDGTLVGFNVNGMAVNTFETDGTYTASPGYLTDAREATKLDAFVPNDGGRDARPWWERMAEYGISRAIDSHYGPPAADKSSTTRTFAGSNGRTYTATPNGGTGGAGPGSFGGILPLILGAAALLLLAK